MLNQVICVGRIVEIEDIPSIDNNLKIRLNIPGTPELDIKSITLDCYVKGSMQENVLQYSEVNDLVGVQGRLINDYGNHLAVLITKYTCLAKKGGDENGTR